ncbi:hypothetical protein MTHERMMSTA1_05330 [Methanosarcina thermophila MST-A1]|nr:hypothetical protein MTHERMMSTA1_05330 [Methanosarcina thermophila MST-A1]
MLLILFSVQSKEKEKTTGYVKMEKYNGISALNRIKKDGIMEYYLKVTHRLVKISEQAV